MEIIVNGDVQSLEKTLTIADFLQEKGIDPGTVIIEHNQEIVKGSNYAETMLNNKDHIEILRFVGGG
ncbi:sulfur carrier protein ThiS [Desulfosediminicola flagellatus]|uniref:sulfur carrier protein ThiS n=1 Tax=Desulfosediminicola flagellatus TaxID=2569541 RepID=UPI0010AC7FFF|nr:sulfur carrier protein ThiS [Desulfosediminicola flagellatus]